VPPPDPICSLKGTVLAAAVVLLAGCSTSTYTVQVDAIAQPAKGAAQAGAPAKSYYLRSKNPKLDESSLRYKEVSDYVKTALSSKGMYEAPKPELADVVIDIDYGMDAPRVKFQTVSSPIIVEEMGRVEMVQEMMAVLIPGTTNYNVVPVWREKVIPGRTDIVGIREEVVPEVVYEKFLKVSARENKESIEGRAPAEVWSVNVSAEDKSQELRKYMPILASATADYIGTNTKEEKDMRVAEKDDSVKFIKKGM
jgi:hypothetical protein